MNLTSYLIEGLLPEQEKKKVVAVYGGGFKPPTSGHFEVVKQALKENPEIDEFIILIGGKPRNGITPDESILIWDIYKQYLPFKVEVKYTSVPPIKGIYNYAKEHPNEEVLFIIGAREGNEEDFKDIASRTTTLDKYPNLNLRTIVTQGGVSGTAARNASKISLEKFKPFVPSELSDEEVEQVFNIVADKIQENDPEDSKAAPYGSGYKKLNENITKSQLDALETYADKLFAKLGIDIEFTRHFLDRANDKRNIKPISIPELMGMFKRLHKKHGKPLSKVDNDFDAVVKDFNSNINIPFAINVTPNDIDLVAKTVMRKKDFKTSTPVISLNENASYSKEINIKEKITQLTRHMIDKGMNIEPLPSMEFVDGDSENAKDFFGKTAYYDPNRQHIVLYTEGRHPKDIVRSYAHEMIHHIQYLEDRLGDVSGTNTTEDDHLDKIEQEANLRGTMTFRNWTDSLNEAIVGDKIECDNCDWSWDIKDGGDDLYTCHKCWHDNTPINEKKNKDPFGLNAYARELGQLNEGRYDKSANQFSKIAFEAFKDIHDRGDKEGTFEFSVGPFEEDIYSDQFEFDFEGYVEITDNEYNVDGGANQGFDKKGDEITPLLNLNFKIPKNPTTNPSWEDISFDIKDVVRHELEHLTQGGLNLKGGAWDEDPKLRRPSKQMADDQLIRDLIDADMLPKSQYYKLEKEVDAMLQGLYFKAKKSKRPFKKVINDYLDIFVKQKTISLNDKEDILDLWRSRGKALSLPIFENQKQNMDYKIYSDMDGVLVDFEKGYEKLTGIDLKGEYRPDGENFWKPIEQAGVGYWAGLEWMPDGKQLWSYLKPFNPVLLSAPSRSQSSRIGKHVWVKHKIPGTKLILRYAKQKQELATPESILIDDRQVNIDQWKAAGGIGILHTSTANTIQQLQKLGL